MDAVQEEMQTQVIQLGAMTLITDHWPTLSQLEKAYLEAALEHTHGSQWKAAEILGITRWTVSRRIQRYAIDFKRWYERR